MKPLLEFSNVTVTRDHRTVLESLSFSIDAGEHVAILGPNGSGKSSLIKVITRECYPRLGSSLRLFGREVWHIFELRALLGIVSNDLLKACTTKYSGREVVLSGFFGSIGVWPNHAVTPEMEKRVDELMEHLEIAHLADQPMNEMSSGEARRVVIGRALVHHPQALVLDEPTSSLDVHAKHELRAMLRKLAQSGISIIMVTHTLTDIIPEIGRVILLKEGRIVQDGPKAQVLTAEGLSGLFGTPVEIMERRGYYHLW